MEPVRFQETTAMEQGMNCEKLYRFLNYMEGSNLKLNSLLILRNGSQVVNLHPYPFHEEAMLYINCCTQCIISALVGIAIGEGLIKSVNEKVWNFFPEYNDLFYTTQDGEQKREISLEDLLKMTAGLEWNDTGVVYGENSYDGRMHASEDTIRFILEQPIREAPGSRYNHCLGAVHLLSAVLHKVSGMDTAEYARSRLFDPLGISDFEWMSDRNGIPNGNGISLPAWGLARIGQLYLQEGRWGKAQIIPGDWIRLSTKKHTDTPDGPWSFYGGGYLWNMNRFGGYSSRGVSGQYLAVVPTYGLVIVMISPLSLDQFYLYETLIETFIIPAVRVPGPGHINLKNQSLLKEKLEELNRPPLPKPVPPLPKLASKISGKEYVFWPQDDIHSLSLDFSLRDSCKLKVWDSNGCNEVLIGLDDVYRRTGKEVMKGYWDKENLFVVKMLQLQFNYEAEYRFTFEGDKLIHEILIPSWGMSETKEGMIG
jgi:CubicO group peptidase (beta-lactamase class C family)